jgi:hypothetical protein
MRSLRPRQIGHVRAGAPCHPCSSTLSPCESEVIVVLHSDSPASPCNTDIWNRVAGPIPGAVPLVYHRGDLRAAHDGPDIASLSLTYDTTRCSPTPLMESWGFALLRERENLEGGHLSCCSPHDNLKPMTRSWLVFQIYHPSSSICHFDQRPLYCTPTTLDSSDTINRPRTSGSAVHKRTPVDPARSC